MALLPDEHCPECHGVPELKMVRKTYLQKRCKDCGHTWFEERVGVDPAPETDPNAMRKGNYSFRCM